MKDEQSLENKPTLLTNRKLLSDSFIGLGFTTFGLMLSGLIHCAALHFTCRERKSKCKCGSVFFGYTCISERMCMNTCGLVVTWVRYSKLFCRRDWWGYVTVRSRGGVTTSPVFSTWRDGEVNEMKKAQEWNTKHTTSACSCFLYIIKSSDFYRVADVDLLSNHCGVIEYAGILFTLFYYNVFIHRLPRRSTF